mmetsp:Transcript_18737/g.41709  ORF Transcript_18737/g.41709 Transcript_18737/m.41709 type:complete len:222 (-) Transcript_18737:1309-1974(-)
MRLWMRLRRRQGAPCSARPQGPPRPGPAAWTPPEPQEQQCPPRLRRTDFPFASALAVASQPRPRHLLLTQNTAAPALTPDPGCLRPSPSPSARLRARKQQLPRQRPLAVRRAPADPPAETPRADAAPWPAPAPRSRPCRHAPAAGSARWAPAPPQAAQEMRPESPCPHPPPPAPPCGPLAPAPLPRPVSPPAARPACPPSIPCPAAATASPGCYVWNCSPL